MRRRPDRLRGLERALWVIGLALTGWYAVVAAQAWIFQAHQRAALDRLIAARAANGAAQPPPDFAPASVPDESRALGEPQSDSDPILPRKMRPPVPGPHRGPNQLIGRLDVPRLGLSAAVVAGDDDATLRVAVGYLPDTPLPWEGGNTALAGHRDSFFSPLRNIAVGDDILLTTVEGDLRYRVQSVFVVEPDATWILDPKQDPTLTLITCFPFNSIGHASWRFVVQASRVE
jgi:sortase A